MSNIQARFEALNSAWNQAFNNRDVNTLAALYAENGVLSPGDGNTLRGRDAIGALFQSFIDHGVHGHTLEIVATGGNEQMAYQVAKWHAFGAENAGATPSFGGITTSVIEKAADGQWLTRSHVWNASA
jgi:uncharacterized protein (TIGR02246 family)